MRPNRAHHRFISIGGMAAAILVLTASVLAFACTAEADTLPKVRILAMGGTIAGAASSATQTKDYKSGALDVASMIRSVPGIEKVADISGEQVANIDSSHMTSELLLKLAARVNEVLRDSAVDGIVVTHGTDTLEETAYFLTLTVKSSKPVVVVGSMRPATAVSADGPLNLYNAVVLASRSSSAGRGVLVALNEQVHSARLVTKTNTTSVDTFRSPDFGCLGYVLDGKTFFYQTVTKRHTTASEFDVPMKGLPRVDIVYGHPDSTRDLIDRAVAAGARGIVIAGMGNGGLFPREEEALVEAVRKGIVVVRASRVGSGIVTQTAKYEKDGFLVSNDLNPQKARVLLILALSKTSNPREIQRIFDEY